MSLKEKNLFYTDRYVFNFFMKKHQNDRQGPNLFFAMMLWTMCRLSVLTYFKIVDDRGTVNWRKIALNWFV